MTLDDMLLDLNTRIGSDPEVDNSNMTPWINQGLRAFCMEDDFTWLEKKVTANTVANQSEYALPSDFKRAAEVQVDGSTDSPSVYTYVPHEQRVLYDSSQDVFSVFNDTMDLSPAPTASGTNNIELWYLRKPTNLVNGSDSPSDSAIASMPEEYHEALILYAFAIYNSYDEEHDEKRELMGNPRSPVPGTYYYYVDLAKREDSKQKRGARRKLMSIQAWTGHAHPNETSRNNTVLGN